MRHIELEASDKEELLKKQSQSGLRSKVLKRVIILLELDKGKTILEVQGVVGVSYPTIATLIKKYAAERLACLTDKKQPGRPPGITGAQRAAITALACSPAPEGHARWSLRLLADKIVELNYCDAISHEWVGQVLKKTK